MVAPPNASIDRAAQALNDAGAMLLAVSAPTQNISISLNTAVDSLNAAVDALKIVGTANNAVAASIDAAAKALVRASAALEDLRDDDSDDK